MGLVSLKAKATDLIAFIYMQSDLSLLAFGCSPEIPLSASSQGTCSKPGCIREKSVFVCLTIVFQIVLPQIRSGVGREEGELSEMGYLTDLKGALTDVLCGWILRSVRKHQAALY